MIAGAPQPPSLAEDLLRGVNEIAQFIGQSRRRTFYLCERGLIPCGKEGATWIASRQALREHYAKATAGKPASASVPLLRRIA